MPLYMEASSEGVAIVTRNQITSLLLPVYYSLGAFGALDLFLFLLVSNQFLSVLQSPLSIFFFLPLVNLLSCFLLHTKFRMNERS